MHSVKWQKSRSCSGWQTLNSLMKHLPRATKQYTIKKCLKWRKYERFFSVALCRFVIPNAISPKHSTLLFTNYLLSDDMFAAKKKCFENKNSFINHVRVGTFRFTGHVTGKSLFTSYLSIRREQEQIVER